MKQGSQMASSNKHETFQQQSSLSRKYEQSRKVTHGREDEEKSSLAPRDTFGMAARLLTTCGIDRRIARHEFKFVKGHV
jgi:hypothetical protein